MTILIPSDILNGHESASVVFDIVGIDDLSENLRTFAEGRTVISLELYLDGERTSMFGENVIRVSLDYVPADGEDMSTIAVWHLNEDSMTLVACENVWFDAVSNKVVFETTHFSYWLVGHETASDEADYMIPSIAIGLILIVGLCVVLLRLKR